MHKRQSYHSFFCRVVSSGVFLSVGLHSLIVLVAFLILKKNSNYSEEASSPVDVSIISSPSLSQKAHNLTTPQGETPLKSDRSDSLVSIDKIGIGYAKLFSNLKTLETEGSRKGAISYEEDLLGLFRQRIAAMATPKWVDITRETIQLLPPARSGAYITVALVTLDAQGYYLNTTIVSSSGDPAIDSSIHRTFKSIQRIPNPPRGLLSQDQLIRIQVISTVDFKRGFTIEADI